MYLNKNRRVVAIVNVPVEHNQLRLILYVSFASTDVQMRFDPSSDQHNNYLLIKIIIYIIFAYSL
jgi:hypothetical protein